MIVKNGTQVNHARCDLHGGKIVDRLPRRCPLGTRNPLATLAAMADAAWAELLTAGGDQGAALAALHAADVCGGCVNTNLTAPPVRRIRATMIGGGR